MKTLSQNDYFIFRDIAWVLSLPFLRRTSFHISLLMRTTILGILEVKLLEQVQFFKSISVCIRKSEKVTWNKGISLK